MDNRTPMIIPMTVSGGGTIPFTMKQESELLSIQMDSYLRVRGAQEWYEGEYTFTPTIEAQTVNIEGLTARRDITIEPIPQNYGLITYNGSTITVS